ncbi:MAG: SRPBCC family protein [Candidatus Kapaibacterium sp.]
MMSFHVLQKTQKLKVSLDEAWEFFSSPKNLATITPDYMNFVVTCEVAEKVYPGQIITYTVSPLLGIPLTWMTEITHVEHRRMFVDEQRIGPYSLWHHQHIFTEIKGGVETTDIVHYALPMGFLGDMVHALMVRKQLEGIFEYRRNVLNKMFGEL